MSNNSQWSLLKQKYFAPLFYTQFLGAFNDNLYKNALVILLAFNTAILPSGISAMIAVNISAGLFILPYFLFSAWAGELADKYEKSKLIRILKIWEIVIITLGVFSLYIESVTLMWITLFGLGIQAAFFGPLKYSILPQHLPKNDLVGGNALIESGTFIAILLGTILGGVLIQLNDGWLYLGVAAWIVAFAGYFTSRSIPIAPATDPDLKVGFNIYKQTKETIKIARKDKTVFLSILGISWFWFFGATLLAQFPSIVKDVLGANESVVTLLLAVFSIGIGVGSLFCEKMSAHKIEIGLVPFGAIGMSIFCLDFYLSLKGFTTLNNASLMQFYIAPGSTRMLLDLIGLSIFGGFFIVPLYAMIQDRSEEKTRSRIIAANNVLNAAFMVGSAIFAIVLSSIGVGINELILALVILNTLTAIYIFTLVPEFLLRFMVWIAINTFYRVRATGLEHVPVTGAGLIISNHVSFVDALIIFGSIRRPVKFVMHERFYNIPLLKYLFNAVGAIPIAGKNENEKTLNAAYEKISQALASEEMVVIFPEGKITADGNMNEFKAGIVKILERNPVVVVPSALNGLYGSVYSKDKKGLLRFLPKTFLMRKVTYDIGDPIYTNDLLVMQEKVKALLHQNNV